MSKLYSEQIVLSTWRPPEVARSGYAKCMPSIVAVRNAVIFFMLAFLASTAFANEDKKAEKLFGKIFKTEVKRSPVFQTRLGIKDDYDKWDDISEKFQAKSHKLAQKYLENLRKIDVTKLSKSNALSHRLMEEELKTKIDFYKWRHHNYPLNQMFGWHTTVPSLLINMHRIDTEKDAKAYIKRIENSEKLIAQVEKAVKLRADKGILPPKFVFPHVIEASENLRQGFPYVSEGEDSTVYADFKKKVDALNISQKRKDTLLKDARMAMLNSMGPAYKSLISTMKTLEKFADTRDGAWKFPDGDQFYEAALRRTTTTNLNAEEIHQLGLKEVERIRNEMQAIKTNVKFEGSLKEFFLFLRNDPQFYYPQTKEGRAAYINDAVALIEAMEARMDELFITQPKSALKVKAVEAFREKSAGKAFYQAPPPDGSRPGIYYANLYNMKEMPKYQMAALAYHEGIPGHHLQLSIAAELKDIPEFRKYGRYTAYIEGWGLYSELLPKEIGLYQDPYLDFGRLALELWRACRLVVDTGIHYKKWSKEKATQYLIDNTPNAERDSVRAIERYIVMPSQATAYKIGMLKILELRAKAKAELGSKFSIRDFHELVLTGGAMPLNVLEDQVMSWIASNK